MGLLTAHASITALTILMVTLNVHSTSLQFFKDRNIARFISFLGTLLIAGSLIITISFLVIDRVMDTELEIRSIPQNRTISDTI